jgi:hypothetical protein
VQNSLQKTLKNFLLVPMSIMKAARTSRREGHEGILEQPKQPGKPCYFSSTYRTCRPPADCGHRDALTPSRAANMSAGTSPALMSYKERNMHEANAKPKVLSIQAQDALKDFLTSGDVKG